MALFVIMTALKSPRTFLVKLQNGTRFGVEHQWMIPNLHKIMSKFALFAHWTSIAVIREFTRFSIKYPGTRNVTISILKWTPPPILQIVVISTLFVQALVLWTSRHFVCFDNMHRLLFSFQLLCFLFLTLFTLRPFPMFIR